MDAGCKLYRVRAFTTQRDHATTTRKRERRMARKEGSDPPREARREGDKVMCMDRLGSSVLLFPPKVCKADHAMAKRTGHRTIGSFSLHSTNSPSEPSSSPKLLTYTHSLSFSHLALSTLSSNPPQWKHWPRSSGVLSASLRRQRRTRLQSSTRATSCGSQKSLCRKSLRSPGKIKVTPHTHTPIIQGTIVGLESENPRTF